MTGLQFTHGDTASIANGISGGGYQLNGLSTSSGGNYLSIARDPLLFGQDQLSIGVAFKAATAGKGGTLFKIHTALQIEIGNDGQVTFNLMANSAGEKGVIKSSGLTAADGAWHHLALSYDAVAGAMIGYVDGVAIGQVAVSAATKVAESWDPTFGDQWGKGFAGTIDNIEIHGAPLTASQAVAQYQTVLKQLDVPPPQLVKLTFDNGVIADSSGNNIAVTAGKVASISDGAYYLNGKTTAEGGNHIALARHASLFEKDEFTLSIDFKSADAGVGGSLFRMHTAMQVDVTAAGDVMVRLVKNAAGESGLIKAAARVADGEWHNVTVSYDVAAGKMTGYVDGVAYGTINVSAPTLAAAFWDPMVGSPWAGGFRGFVDNVTMTDAALPPTINPKPVAGADMAHMRENTSLTLTAEKLLANDHDPQGQALSITDVKMASGQGTVALVDGNVVFTPNADWHGVATVEYTLRDAMRAKDTGVVRIEVAPTDADAPVAPLAFASAMTSGETIIVGSSAELLAALRGVHGGETILLRSGVDYKAIVTGVPAHAAQVTVTSLDPNDPATIVGLDLRAVTNVTFSNLRFAFEGTPVQWQTDVVVSGGDGIRFAHNVFKGVAEGYVPVGTSTAESMMSVTNTKNFVFEHNEVSNFFHGIGVGKSENVIIRDNDIHELQGDGLRFSQMKSVLIENNRLHDFLGSDAAVNHNDYIQFWTASTTAPSTDIVIRGNVLLSGDYQPQAIFLRDDQGDAGVTGLRYQRVTIEDNVIYNSNAHAITTIGADGLTIRGNTILEHPAGSAISAINVTKATGVVVYDNVAPRIEVGATNQVTRLDGNVVVQDAYAINPGYVPDLFVNPTQGTGISLDDLFVRPDGALVRADGSAVGSDLLHPGATPDQLTAVFTAAASRGADGRTTLSFDASHTANQDGYVHGNHATFLWDFGDGKTETGRFDSHTYAKAGDYQVLLTVFHNDGSTDTARLHASIKPELAAALDFDDGLAFQHHSVGEVWG